MGFLNSAVADLEREIGDLRALDRTLRRTTCERPLGLRRSLNAQRAPVVSSATLEPESALKNFLGDGPRTAWGGGLANGDIFGTLTQ